MSALPGPAHEIARALAVLQSGGLVGLPTETVYGLAADASNPAAVARIFAAKGRPADHPVIVHLADAQAMRAWAIDLPDVAWQLAKAFWPGPMTLIVKRAPHVLDAVTGGQDTVGLRVPSHPVAHALFAAFAQSRPGRPAGVAAPSANKFGRVSPTTAQHVRDEFGAEVDIVLNGGACEVGIESTIVDVSHGAPRILRPGFITTDMLERALGAALGTTLAGEALQERPSGPHPKKNDGRTEDAPRVSGSLDAHYAPRTPTFLVPAEQLAPALARHSGQRVALFSFSAAPSGLAWHAQASRNPAAYAQALYATLRTMDAAGCDVLLVEAPPGGPAWDGVNDRLRRAAFGSHHPA